MYHRQLATVLCVFLLVITLGVFFQVIGHEWINLDDPVYITNNPSVKGGITTRSIAWAFTATTASNWHPLTWLSHMADVKIFGMNPSGHHLMNVLVHMVSTLLLFMLLKQMTKTPWQSLFVAALFALHPLHVESVAWVAERKDVLSGFFCLLTLLFYVAYARQGQLKYYLLTFFSFVAGLMSKPMGVTLPIAMLLLDYWPLDRFSPQQGEGRRSVGSVFWFLVREKIPFLLSSTLSAMITIYAQSKGGAMKSLAVIPFATRVENAIVAYAKYLGKTIWPSDLAILYPFPPSVPLWQVLGSSMLIVVISVATIRYRRRYPYLLVGWLWFLITLVPVIGLIQVGGQCIADRYTYLPLTGIFIIVAWGIPDLVSSWRYRKVILAVSAGVIIFASAATTWHQLGYWKDNITLYRHTLQVTTGNYLIHNNYGIALADQGRLDEAILEYQEALRAWPQSATAHVNLGATLAHQGRFTEAVHHYNEALQLVPDYALAHGNLGRALVKLGRTDEAIVHYEEALKIDPSFADIHLNLSILLLKTGQHDRGFEHYRSYLRLEPNSTKGPINMGAELAQEGNLAEAIDCFNDALHIDPKSIEAHFNLGVALARQNRTAEAAQHFSLVLSLRPDLEAARRWLETLKQRE